ncbi:hypothetical protein VE02_00662 [Pseudogymnoascus sp. 03VT05]|nr:hypothetical protein VE02_00662 [Pseudogymnoascus sp. 03VT05]
MGDQELLDNIDGRMHGPMSGFIKRYFGSLQCDPQDATPSATPSLDDFLQWFSNHVSREVGSARGSWHIPEHGSDNDGARLLLSIPASPASGVQTRWDDVQVIGQFNHRACVSYQDGLLRLCRSAYEVFASQPTRLFLHGFYVRGPLIELWVFDRSGLYCSDYQRMTDQELGKLDIIEMDEGGSYITLDGVDMPLLGKLYLESQPIASRERLVGTGTTCYRVRTPGSDRWGYVLKFKWRWARDRPENELLKLASDKCVWGAVSLDYYEEIENLDSAIELSELSETETGITGTRPFIAIGALKKKSHTYRHDLESFLYVFLWTIITNHTEDPPERSKLRQWSNGEWEGLAVRKSLDMGQDSFQEILGEFTVEFESLKPLAER